MICVDAGMEAVKMQMPLPLAELREECPGAEDYELVAANQGPSNAIRTAAGAAIVTVNPPRE